MPDAPALVTIPNVPLMETGEWNLSTGVATFTADDLASAVAAQDDPGVRTPVIKIGHGPQPGGLERPVIGRIENMRVENEGQTLVGDLVGVPKWLADVMAYAYPQRSVEGSWQLKSATGNTHRFALTGVALLGETDPGISTLDDLKALWDEPLPEIEIDGVNASHGILVRASMEERMPPRANVRAAVEVDDVRRTFYEDPEMQKALGTWAWIRAVRLDPTDLIVDDDDGGLWRVPYVVGEDDSISFEDPVQVVIEYRDQAAAASAGPTTVRFDSPEESRRGTMAEAAVKASNTDQPKEGMMDVTIDQARALLGLGDDADEEAVQAALEERLAGGDEPEPEVDPEDEVEPEVDPEDEVEPEGDTTPEGVVTIDKATLDTLQRQAAAGAKAAERQRTEDRDRYIAAAVKDGRIVPARASHWKAQYDKDEAGTRAFIDSQPKGLVPVDETGHGGDGDEIAASGAEYPMGWLSPAERERVAAARTN